MTSIDYEIVQTMQKRAKANTLGGEAFFVVDLARISNAVELWNRKLPNITPYYAVKCNNNLMVLKVLASMNVNFDCASKGEISMVLNLGVDAKRIIYANPCKMILHIKSVYQQGINLTTVDNVDELYKLKQYSSQMGILVRVMTDDELAQCRLLPKFGCDIVEAQAILKIAKSLRLNIKGVAFHVGSGSTNFDAIHSAIKDSRFVFDKALELGFTPNILDIGGGFQANSFDGSSSKVNYSLGKFFPPLFVNQLGIEFIAEPGRFIVSDAFTLCCNVIAKRDTEEGAMIYINDGIYGNLNCVIYDHQIVVPQLLFPASKLTVRNYSIWGPTCDGLDCITKSFKCPYIINIGDWIYFENVGAYTLTARTSFNGFNNENEFIYLNR